ncbi:unnamed protein product [Caenorhabditis auriculariae]|uniref:CDP-diacylglycerol--glycerol-3-phosphate 3-phosphatidyltransferase n=1 Tax=Caenorhabditis auriculariae TaxID=2777116 RepID=A0A8S1HZA7_9PELO|nr:unnamed protein product [Caenorhabditis auriculariae]
MDWLPCSLPGIEIDSSNVRIVETPSEFYQLLLERSEKAKSRITLSSLYLGDGKLEKDLVTAVEKNMSRNPDLEVSVLVDFLRGTRGAGEEKSSTTLLHTIAKRAKIYLYHTPDLRGFIKRLLPERTNEIIGLQHMKLYIFDDSILISGANLSDSYFTNRQDRYVLFENCKPLVDFFSDIVEAVGSCSFVLNSDGTTTPHKDCSVHPFQGNAEDYREMMRGRINTAIQRYKEKSSAKTSSESWTVVYPVVQMGPLGIHQEFDLLKSIFSRKDSEMNLTMASGYFNCIRDYEDMIFKEGTFKMDVITAAPEANGFFGARGVSGYVPAMYSDVAKKFLELRSNYERENLVLHEYARKDWTFHAKGLWLRSKTQLATLVGSSNYGYRSVHRDLEAQVLLVTKDEQLIEKLEGEKNRLFEFATVLDANALRRAEHNVPTLEVVLSEILYSDAKKSLEEFDSLRYMIPGLILGKAILEKLPKATTSTAQVARASSSLSQSTYNGIPRRKVVRTSEKPFAPHQLLRRLGGTSVRLTNEQVRRDQELLVDALKNTDWVAVYRYPGVRAAKLLARAKLVQTIASLLYLPYSTFQYFLGNAEATWYYTCAGLAVVAPLMLVAFSRYLNRLIGVIAMDPDNAYIRVGYLTFWGSRKDAYIELSDVLPLSEIGSKDGEKLVKFMWYSGSTHLYLPTKHAEIVDKKRAELIFGDLDIFYKHYKNK